MESRLTGVRYTFDIDILNLKMKTRLCQVRYAFDLYENGAIWGVIYKCTFDIHFVVVLISG
jgi:hypothetical protein